MTVRVDCKAHRDQSETKAVLEGNTAADNLKHRQHLAVGCKGTACTDGAWPIPIGACPKGMSSLTECSTLLSVDISISAGVKEPIAAQFRFCPAVAAQDVHDRAPDEEAEQAGKHVLYIAGKAGVPQTKSMSLRAPV